MIEDCFGLLNERQHVAHTENARGQTVRMELVEVRQLFAGGGKRDGLADDVFDGERGTATSITVELGGRDA